MIPIDGAKADERRGCKGCSGSVHVSSEQIGRLIAKLRAADCVTDELYTRRLQACGRCDSLAYESTCMHCGCFVQVRAKFKDKECPHPDRGIRQQWTPISEPIEEARA